ncbi:hypothetical protein UFOVP353_59 [uncultured Caudovirales phage]|uniref:Uncharacterized protein n=1 Tax=uncultured Caudovirales phage TaxID=2100421 RepID=A0A6J5M427_9CAUD|nr:hypothetical protein UFOVP353_59 [uncultured Caudovirales phage]
MIVDWGKSDFFAKWTEERIPHVTDFGPCAALGVVSGDKVLAGVVFHDYQPDFKTIQLSMAADSPRWATRNIIKELLSYPFFQLGVEKVWTSTPHTNERAIKFNKGIGFKQEAVLAKHFGDRHAVVCRIFKKDYERLF